MKKRFMGMISMLMVLVMTLGMCVTGYAADGSYSITVENSIGGKTYSAYKIFDATYNEDTGAVSYTIDSTSSKWYQAVSEATDVFTLTATSVEGVYQVTVKEGVSDTQVIAVIENAFDADTMEAAQSGTGNGGELVLSLEDPGYYYVTTGSGTIISITTAAPDGVVYDKNETPGGDTFKKDADETAYSIGGTATYTIESYVPTYDGDMKVVSYTFTDTMGAGLTYDSSSLSVIINGTGVTDLDITDNCNVTTGASDVEGETVLTVTYEIADIESYPADATITITYTATVNEAADDDDLYNSVDMTWVTDDTSYIPEPGPTPGTHSYVYGFDLAKVGANSVALDGAQFELTDSSGNKISFVYVETETEGGAGTYEVTDGLDSSEETTTIIEVGEANIWGLGAGTYTLTEIVAPDGYNLLESPVTIVIATLTNESTGEVTGWTVTVDDGNPGYGSISDDSSHGVSSMPTVSIVNAAGTALPGTGGIGTTIFYVVGTLCVLAAAVLVVTKVRLGKTE